MPLDKNTLIKLSMEKSEQALETAYDCLNKDLVKANNRIYYSIYYIVKALSYLDDFITSSHHSLMGWFNKKYIHENKIFDLELSKIYSQSQRNREKFDYDVAQFPNKESTIENLEKAKCFVKIVSEYIKTRIEEK